jgi:hypothetical protein
MNYDISEGTSKKAAVSAIEHNSIGRPEKVA